MFGRSVVLSFPDVPSFEDLEFRLVFALWKLANGRSVHIAFASDAPRLSAAEAYEDSTAAANRAATNGRPTKIRRIRTSTALSAFNDI